MEEENEEESLQVFFAVCCGGECSGKSGGTLSWRWTIGSTWNPASFTSLSSSSAS